MSVAILVIAMLAVGYVFTTVTRTSGLTTAYIELTDTVDVLRRTMQDDLDAMAPGLLIVDSPDPNLVHPEPNYVLDAPGEQLPSDPSLLPDYAPRRDRLVFLTSTAPGTYQSWFYTDATSGEALICYGHGGLAASESGDVPVPVQLPDVAYDRILLRRAVLLGVNDALNGEYPLYGLLPDVDLVFRLYLCADDAVQETLGDLLARLRSGPAGAARFMYLRSGAGPSLDRVSGGFIGGTGVGDDGMATWANHAKHCFELMPRVGHFIVEWTDGTTSPAGGLMWYGLLRDVDRNGEINEADVQPVGVDLELDPTTTGDYPGYRAMWRVDNGTWRYRPKALRVTVRLYDENKRVRDGDERLGRKYSFVLKVP